MRRYILLSYFSYRFINPAFLVLSFMLENDIQIIIMTGGVGSRFWPMSTSDYPKQFIEMLRCTYCTMDVKLDGVPVRLFFCKLGRKGNLNGLLTTDLSLSFLEAYRIYARRWAIEVAYKDCKTLLNFCKCQSVHFAAQIASFTLKMMQYNILCTVKRFEAYETIGGLFTEVTNDTLELSVTDKIWAIILGFVLEAAERYSIDATELLADFIGSNPAAHTLRNMYIYKQAS